MADDLDQGYMQTRQAMRQWQSQMLLMEPTQEGNDVQMGAGLSVKPGEEQASPPPAPAPIQEPTQTFQRKTDAGRPIINLPDGSIETEKSATIEDPRINGGKPTNIPTIYGGKHVTEQEAIEIIAKSQGVDPDTGRPLEGFESIEAAVEAAKARSAELGKKYSNPRPDITVDTPDMAAVRQQGKEQMKPFVFDLDTFEVPGDVLRAGLAKLSGVDRGDKAGQLRMSSDEMVNRVFFQYGDKPEEVIKQAESLGMDEAQTLKVMAGLSAVVLGMATDPLNFTPGGKAKDVAKVGKVAGEAASGGRAVATVEKAAQPRRSYDEIQKDIDALEDRLEAQGLNPVKMFDPTDPQQAIMKDAPGYQPEPPELTALYKERFAVEAMEKGQFVEAVAKQSGISPDEAKAALAAIRIKPDQITALLSDSLKDWGKQTHTNIQALYNHFARQKSQEGDALATFHWGGTADNPQLIGQSEGRRPLDPAILRKVEQVYNAVAENIGQGKISLTKHEEAAGLLDDGKTIDVKGKVFDEFKRAANILKSERGSVPLTPGGAGPEEVLSQKQLALISKREQAKSDFNIKVEGFKEELTKQRRGPVLSDEAVRKLAGQSGFTLQDLLDLKPGSILAPEIQVAARDVFKASATKMKASAKAYLERADPQAFDEFAQAFAEAGTATTRIIGTFAEGGRTFRLLNQKFPTLKTGVKPDGKDPEFSIQDQYIKQMYEFFRGAEEKSAMGGFEAARGGASAAPGMVSPAQLAQMVLDLPNEDAIMKFAQQAAKPTWGDMFIEMWINGLLSGPITHSTNIISNTATLLWNIPERQLAGMLNPKAVRPSEAAAMVGGVIESIGDAWRLAWKAFKEEQPQFGQSKLEMPRRAITADALEVTGSVGRAVDFLASAVGLGNGKWLDVGGTAVRLPGRFLMAGDDFFKSIAFRAELRALAKRQAFREINEMSLTGKAAAQKAKEIEKNILDNPPESIKEAAQEFAAYTTFTRELGENGQKVQALASTPVGRIILPFVRTPTNIFKFFGERTPLALASRAVREELAAGGERAALAQAKIALGAMTMAYIGTLAASGHFTGGGPKDKTLRKNWEMMGKKPYSFKVGDQWISYARIEPLGSLFGLAADAADLMGQLPEADANKLASAIVVAISRNLAQKTFIKGLSGTLNAVTSQDVNQVSSFLEKELPTILPFSSALGQTARNIDPVMREVNSIMDAYKAKIPGLSSDLPPRRNLWGEPVLLEGGLGLDLLSPFYSSTVKDDKVAEELDRIQAPIQLPSRQIDGVPLTPKQYERYQILAAHPHDMPSLRDKLNEVIQSDLYKNGTDDSRDGGKITLLKMWVNQYRDLAKIQLQQEIPELEVKIRDKQMKSAQKFSGAAPGGLNR